MIRIRFSLVFIFLWIGLTACEHKDLCYDHPHFATVRVIFDWTKISNHDKPEGMRVVFYPTDDESNTWIFDFPGGYDGKDDPAYSLAIIKWENTYKLGIRWNIAYSEWDDYRKQNGQDECIGNPQSRGIPTWFVLPDDMMFSEKFSGAMQRLDELRKGK